MWERNSGKSNLTRYEGASEIRGMLHLQIIDRHPTALCRCVTLRAVGAGKRCYLPSMSY